MYTFDFYGTNDKKILDKLFFFFIFKKGKKRGRNMVRIFISN